MTDFWLTELGNQIKAARERRGWSQGRLADLVGVSRTMISNYETGKMPPGVEKVTKIATVLETEFTIEGCRIASLDLPARPVETAEQLCLQWDLDYTVSATLVIRPVRGAIHIGGLAKLPKRA